MKILLQSLALTVLLGLQFSATTHAASFSMWDKPQHQAEWIALQHELFVRAAFASGVDVAATSAKIAPDLPEQFQIFKQPVAVAQLQAWARRRPATLQLDGALHCEDAPEISSEMFAAGWRANGVPSNAPRWFKLSLPSAAQWTVNAYASDDDPALSAFLDCNAPPSASADDNLLLQPALTLPKAAIAKLWLRLDRAIGAATLITPLATGRITGMIQGPAGAVSSAFSGVRAFSLNGALVSESTLANGAYSLDLQPNRYYLVARSSSLISQLYDNVECPDFNILQCDLANATILDVVADQTLSQINFTLTAGGKILGRVTDEQTGLGVQTLVYVRGTGTSQYSNVIAVGEAGRLEISRLPAGQYLLTAAYDRYSQTPSQRYLAQQYIGLNCSGPSLESCIASGNVVVVPRDQTRTEINFRLRPISSIFGTITFGSGSYEPVQIELLDASGNVVAGANTSPTYTLSNIPVGGYRMRFSTPSIRMLYPDLICAMPSCADQIAQATVLQISGATTNLYGIDAHFPSHRTLTGRVRDRLTGQALAAQVQLRQGAISLYSQTNSLGEFQFYNPPAGAVALLASSYTHLDEIYPNLQCQTQLQTYCDFGSNAPANLNIAQLGSTEADFQLSLGATVSGRLLRISGKPQNFNGSARLRTASGAVVSMASGTQAAPGYYSARDLAPGVYVVDWPENAQFFAAPGQSFTLGLSENLIGPSLVLPPKQPLEGRVTNSSGVGIAGVVIDAWGGTRYRESAQTDADGWYWLSNSSPLTSTLALSTDAPGFTNQIHSAIACPLGSAYSGHCDIRTATTIPSPAIFDADHLIHFQMEAGAPSEQIFSDGFEF